MGTTWKTVFRPGLQLGWCAFVGLPAEVVTKRTPWSTTSRRSRSADEGLGDVDAEGLVGEVAHLGDLSRIWSSSPDDVSMIPMGPAVGHRRGQVAPGDPAHGRLHDRDLDPEQPGRAVCRTSTPDVTGGARSAGRSSPILVVGGPPEWVEPGCASDRTARSGSGRRQQHQVPGHAPPVRRGIGGPHDPGERAHPPLSHRRRSGWAPAAHRPLRCRDGQTIVICREQVPEIREGIAVGSPAVGTRVIATGTAQQAEALAARHPEADHAEAGRDRPHRRGEASPTSTPTCS